MQGSVSTGEEGGGEGAGDCEERLRREQTGSSNPDLGFLQLFFFIYIHCSGCGKTISASSLLLLQGPTTNQKPNSTFQI